MNLSRTLELDNRFYQGEVAARIALFNTLDLQLEPEFKEVVEAFYTFVKGKVDCILP